MVKKVLLLLKFEEEKKYGGYSIFSQEKSQEILKGAFKLIVQEENYRALIETIGFFSTNKLKVLNNSYGCSTFIDEVVEKCCKVSAAKEFQARV